MREKLQTLSLVVLREFAKDKKIKGITAMRKAELIDAIIEASGGFLDCGFIIPQDKSFLCDEVTLIKKSGAF